MFRYLLDDDDDDDLMNNYCTEALKLEFKMHDITANKCTHCTRLGISNWRFDEQRFCVFTVGIIIERWTSFSVLVRKDDAENIVLGTIDELYKI